MPIPAKRPPPGADIEYYFKRRRFLERAQCCILSPHWSDFIGAMRNWGYSECGIFTTLRHSFRFSEYLAQDGIHDLRLLDDSHVTRYISKLRSTSRTIREVQNSLSHLLMFLRDRGIISPPPESLVEADHPLVTEYMTFLAQHRGVGDITILRHREQVIAFIEALDSEDKDLKLNAKTIFDFVTLRAKNLSRHQRKSMCWTLRSFLRFLHMKGYISQELADAVPVIPSFKLDRLPHCIDSADIDIILSAIDRTTALGRRDYAILLLLGTYGLRQGQLCSLRLEDIDWCREILRVPAAKDGRDILLPLRPAVGEAIIDYLRHGRPNCPFREIFLRVRPPIAPLGGFIMNIIRAYAKKVGFKDIPTGAHAWRHGCASRMLANGQSLKTISDILGHRSIESTFIYTKIDIGMLRQAALEWPGALS